MSGVYAGRDRPPSRMGRPDAASPLAAFVGALEREGAAKPFEHDGALLKRGVPSEALRAYAAGRLGKADAGAILAAMVAAYMAPGTPFPDDGRSFVWLCARAWAARCADLERAARGRAGR